MALDSLSGQIGYAGTLPIELGGGHLACFGRADTVRYVPGVVATSARAVLVPLAKTVQVVLFGSLGAPLVLFDGALDFSTFLRPPLP